MPTATLTDSSGPANDDFGVSVSLSSDGATALIGATGRNSGSGAADVFQTSSEGAWTSSSSPTATLSNGSGAAGDYFASSVSLSSDDTTALIGDFDANSGSGGAYVFSTPVTTYTLNVDKSGAGSGTVSSTDGSVDCGSTCMLSYSGGSYVTLNAQPGADSTFAGWSGGGCTGTGSCVVEIVSDTTVTATFNVVVIIPPMLTVSLTGTPGSVSSSPAGISCPGTCGAEFTPGTMVTLTAAPASGQTFAGWSGPSCTYLITGACLVTTSSAGETVTATFTAAASGPGAMTVSPTSVSAGSKDNTLTFTYTAGKGGTSGGEIEVAVPSRWSAPSRTASAAGYVTSTCGKVSVSESNVKVTGVTLAAGKSCTATYGSKAGKGPGAIAPTVTGIDTFTTSEASSSSGTSTRLAASPAVKVR